MYQDSWDKMIHTQCNARYEKLEKETQIKISNLEECVRIKDRQHIIRANDDFIIFENLRAQVNELQSQNENLKSKVVECTMCQNLQVQVEELKSVNESLNLSVEELSKARALAEATLRERDELVFCSCGENKNCWKNNCCEPFYEVQSEFDLEKVHDTQDNSEKDLILSLQTQLKETAELVVHFSNEKYCALKEIESLKVEIKNLQTENKDLKSREFELNTREKVYETKESVLFKDIHQMKFQVSELLEKLNISDQEMKQQIIIFEEDNRMFLASNDVLKHRLETKTDKFETYFANLEKENALLKSQLASQNYTSLQKENNDLRTSYNVLKETHETFCENLEKENNDLKMHYKRLFDSIKQKKVVSQVFTKSIPKVNVSEKIYTGKSSKPISRKVSQFTTYSLQKDRKYLKKQHSFETFASQNYEKNESSKQIWKRKGENISKRFKYSKDEMFSMRKRDDSVLKKVKDVRFPFISKRIFQNETPSFNKWKSSSSSKVKTSNETPGFRTVFTPLRTFKTPNETSRFYKSNWTNEKSFKSPLIPRKLFQNETSGFKSPWNSTSMHQIDATYIWFSKYGKPVSNVLKWVPKVVA
ncbi:hypothetical protein Tco_0836208 [Tanacetum coccineum]